MHDLRGADNLLQKAIEKVEDGRKPDTTQVERHAVNVLHPGDQDAQNWLFIK